MKTNVFYHGDCLFVMKHDISSKSVDLIYLDPPFISGKVQKGSSWEPGSMEMSFDDSRKFWKEKGLYDNEKVPEWIKHIAKRDSPMAAYLYYIMERLEECHRILKET